MFIHQEERKKGVHGKIGIQQDANQALRKHEEGEGGS